MHRLSLYVGFLLLLSGCGRGVSDPGGNASDPPGAPSSRAAQPPDAPGKPPGVRLVKTSENLLRPDGFAPFEKGGGKEGETFVCDNGNDATVVRGFMHKIRLDQAKPEPVFA